jgi:hypothetical protein
VAALTLAFPAAVALAEPAVGPAGARYVFSFNRGLARVHIGEKTTNFQALFRKAVRLADVGGQTCYGLAYAVSPAAQKARTADVELFCGDHAVITETRLASSAFCSTKGTCIGTPGSLRKFANEVEAVADVLSGGECLDGRRGCSSIEARFGRVNASVRSSNCRTFTSLAKIGANCIAADVLIYRLD